MFKALGDETRRLILDELATRDGQPLFEICTRLTMRHGLTSTRQAISQHLAVLEDAGLVTTERHGRTKLHYFNREPLTAIWQRWPTPPEGHPMRIRMTSLYVDDQRAALAFYTDVLGFTKRHDIPLGEDFWVTVISPEDPDGPELLLEPSQHPAVKPYRDALIEDGIPLAQFTVDNVHTEYERLTQAGVSFTQPPTDIGTAVVAVFDDTCGNLIQIITPGPEST